MPERLFGLIGKSLTHSFSKTYFTDKFQKEGIRDCRYELFPLPEIDAFPDLLAAQPELAGLNVTIPYKEAVMAYLDELDAAAAEAGSVNVIALREGVLKGYNTDIIGFEQSLCRLLPAQKSEWPERALVFGTGGASKAIVYVLKRLAIAYQMVSRKPAAGQLSYADVQERGLQNTRLLVNTTPVGTYPDVDSCLDLPYDTIGPAHFLFDLVYNPEKTLFLKRGQEHGAAIRNGLEMLHDQAEAAWSIWNSPIPI